MHTSQDSARDSHFKRALGTWSVVPAAPRERALILQQFRRETRLLITTPFDALGSLRDDNKADVVINYDMPTDHVHYPLSVKSCRPGKSVVINFVRDEDVKTLREIEDAYNVRIEETPMNVFELLQNNMEGERKLSDRPTQWDLERRDGRR